MDMATLELAEKLLQRKRKLEKILHSPSRQEMKLEDIADAFGGFPAFNGIIKAEINELLEDISEL